MKRNATKYSVVLFFAAIPHLNADWTQFRGNDGTSVAGEHLPTEFGGEQAKNIAWETKLPGRAVSGPIIVGDRVIATSSSGTGQKRLHIFGIDDATGAVKWERRLWATGRTLCHPLSAVAAPTPASDGKRLFAFFASNDLVCLSLEGDVQWIRALSLEFPGAFDDRGLASSPCVVEDTVVVQIACSDDSNAFGIDTGSGQTRWKLPLAKSTSWASPCPIRFNGQSLVMLQSAERLVLVDPATGKVEHEYEAEGNLIPSPAFADDTFLVPADGMTALKFTASSDEAEVLWQETKLAAESTSPVISGGMVFVVRSPNLLTAGELKDGNVAWKTRLKGSGFWATPLVSDTNIYVPNTDGLVQVVNVADGEVVAENDLQQEILGSPAASEGALYLRSTQSVIKVAS